MNWKNFFVSAMILGITSISVKAEVGKDYTYLNEYFETLNTEMIISSNEIEWVQFAPGMSGDSDGTFIHPTDDNYIFSFPDMHNSYRSTDGGKTWSTIINPDYAMKSQFSRVYALDFSRQDDTFGMAANSAGVRISTNKGASFGDIVLKANIEVLTVDPTNDNIWFAGTGDFWSTKSNYRTDTKLHGNSPKVPGKLYKTIDKGQTWNVLQNTGIHPQAEFGSIYIYPENTDLMFATTTYGLYKSVDGGTSWAKIESIEEANGEDFDLIADMDIYIDPETKKLTLYAIKQTKYTIDHENGTVISNGGILKSHDLGESWEDITGDLGINIDALDKEVYALVNDVLIPENIEHKGGDNFIGMWFRQGWFMGRYFAKSPQLNGKTIHQAIPNLPTLYLHPYDNIEVDPTNPNKIYLGQPGSFAGGMYVGDLWTTDDGGKDWYIATRSGLAWNYPSEYWESENQDTSINLQLDHNYDYPLRIYEQQGLRDFDLDSQGNAFALFRTFYKSEDGGKYWQNLDSVQTPSGGWIGTGESNLPGKQIITDPRDPNLLYMLAGENGLFRRTDDGPEYYYDDTVAMINYPYSPPNSSMIVISPDDINEMYALILRQEGQGEFKRSLDGGQTWEKISQIFDTGQISTKVVQKGFIIDPNNTDTMYFGITATNVNEVPPLHGTEYSGVYKTTDRGLTWKKITNGLPGTFDVFDLEFSPNSTDIIYAASSAGNAVTPKNMETLGQWNLVQPEGSSITNALNPHGQSAVTFSGSGLVATRELTDLIPNTEYFISSYTQSEENESAIMSVLSPNGDILGSQSVANNNIKVEGVFFTTGPATTEDEKCSVILKLEKTSGTGKVFFDKFTLKTAGGLYISHDRAETWAIDESFPKIAQANNVVTSPDGKIYVAAGNVSTGIEHGGLWVGDGTTWTKIFEHPKVVDVKIDPYNPGRIMIHVAIESSGYANYNSGIYISEDYGQTWTKINQGLGTSASIYDFAFDPDPEQQNTLWLTSSAGGFYKGFIGGAPEREQELAIYDVKMISDDFSYTQQVEQYSKVLPITPPDKDGFIFDGWLNGDLKHNFNTPVIKDMILEANWITE